MHVSKALITVAALGKVQFRFRPEGATHVLTTSTCGNCCKTPPIPTFLFHLNITYSGKGMCYYMCCRQVGHMTPPSHALVCITEQNQK